jgi:PKD domain
LVPPVSPTDFGKIPVLNEKKVELILTNAGRAKMTVSNVVLKTENSVFKIVSFPETIESGNDEKIVVVFKPVKEEISTNVLHFETDDDSNASVDIVLNGEGSTRAVAVVEPAAIDFMRVPECASAVQLLTIKSTGTADLIIEKISFSADTSAAFTFVGSTKTPATVKSMGANGLPGQIQLTVRVAAAAMSQGMLAGKIVLATTDPDRREILIPLKAQVNRAPIAKIAPLQNGAPGLTVMLDGTGSMDSDGDNPISYKWTLRSKPLASGTTIDTPEMASTSMKLDATVPGSYEVQLDVTDSAGTKSCTPARATLVAAPAQKLLVEMFWDNPGTDIDLHVLKSNTSSLYSPVDDCFYQNRAPDWGLPMGNDNPLFARDALTGFGPEIFGYVNPINSTYRVLAIYENELLSASPASKVTLRVYSYGILKTEVQRSLLKKGDIWEALDVG